MLGTLAQLGGTSDAPTLKDVLRVRPTSLQRTLDTLARRGWITQTPHAERHVHLRPKYTYTLTSAGRTVLEEVHPQPAAGGAGRA